MSGKVGKIWDHCAQVFHANGRSKRTRLQGMADVTKRPWKGTELGSILRAAFCTHPLPYHHKASGGKQSHAFLLKTIQMN